MMHFGRKAIKRARVFINGTWVTVFVRVDETSESNIFTFVGDIAKGGRSTNKKFYCRGLKHGTHEHYTSTMLPYSVDAGIINANKKGIVIKGENPNLGRATGIKKERAPQMSLNLILCPVHNRPFPVGSRCPDCLP